MNKNVSLSSDYNEEKEREILTIFQKNKQSNFKTLMAIYRGHFLELFLSVIFFVMKHSPTWVIPIVTANVINIATNPGKHPEKGILFNTILLLILILQNILTNYVHTYFYAKAIRNVERDLRSSMVRKLQQLSISYHNSLQSGRLQSKIMRDVEQVETLSQQIFISLLSILLNVTVALGVVIFKDLTVFLFFLATIPVAIIIMVTFRKKIRSYNTDFRKSMEETSAKVMEMVELIPVTRAHALEQHESKKMDSQLTQVAKKGLKLDILQSYFGSIGWVTFQCFQVLCLAFTGMLAAGGKIGVGDVVLYQTYFGNIIGQISNVILLLPTLTKGLESVRSIGDILLCDELEDKDSKSKMKLSSVKGDITFEHVDFQYPKTDEILFHDLSFHINPGETIAFVGPSGAGKTTILNLVIGFQRPSKGKILIDGKDMNSLHMQSFRSHISVVPQTSILFTGTIRDNITYGMEHISDKQLNEVIKAANLDELIASLPDGLDTIIQEHGNNLSGGQKQRISIARAFIRNPKILILDEATSALDTISEKKIQNAISNLVKNRTTLIVAHRLSTIHNADKIAVIGEGGIQEFGTFQELIERKGVFYEMEKLQTI